MKLFKKKKRKNMLKVSVKSCPLLDFCFDSASIYRMWMCICIYERERARANADRISKNSRFLTKIPFHWLMQTTVVCNMASVSVCLFSLTLSYSLLAHLLECLSVCVSEWVCVFFASQTATVFCRMHNEFFE